MCMIETADDHVILLDSTDYRSRKEHQCSECRGIIERGETYHYESYIFDGEFHAHKTCHRCMAARQWLTRECGGYVYGLVLEDLIEHLRDGHISDGVTNEGWK